MAPPSRLAIATSAVQRLVKEEASYHKELKHQESRIHQFEASSSDEEAQYQLKQERQALSETRTVLESMKVKIKQAVEQLEEQLEQSTDNGGEILSEDITKGRQVAVDARQALREDS